MTATVRQDSLGDSHPFADLPHHHFAVILADPPWHFKVYNEATGSSRAASNHYDLMDTAAICRLPVKDYLAARDAVLHLWVTAPFLRIAFDVLAAWGFTYSSNLVWTKDKLGTGYWARSQHEHVLIGKRGKFHAPAPAHRPPSVIQAPRREHSRKPDEVYSIIEQAYPEFAKIELFARHARPGWTAWGDEAPSTTQNKQNGIATMTNKTIRTAAPRSGPEQLELFEVSTVLSLPPPRAPAGTIFDGFMQSQLKFLQSRDRAGRYPANQKGDVPAAHAGIMRKE